MLRQAVTRLTVRHMLVSRALQASLNTYFVTSQICRPESKVPSAHRSRSLTMVPVASTKKTRFAFWRQAAPADKSKSPADATPSEVQTCGLSGHCVLLHSKTPPRPIEPRLTSASCVQQAAATTATDDTKLRADGSEAVAADAVLRTTPAADVTVTLGSNIDKSLVKVFSCLEAQLQSLALCAMCQLRRPALFWTSHLIASCLLRRRTCPSRSPS